MPTNPHPTPEPNGFSIGSYTIRPISSSSAFRLSAEDMERARHVLGDSTDDTDIEAEFFDDQEEEEQPHGQYGCVVCGLGFAPSIEESFRWVSVNGTAYNGLICDPCNQRHFRLCDECHGTALSGNMARVTLPSRSEPSNICSDCLDTVRDTHNLGSCRNCGHLYALTSETFTDRCENCVTNMRESGQILYRKYRNEPSLIGKERGATVKSLRPFGIELETFCKSQKRAIEISYQMPVFMGVAQDGSIKSDGIGLEFQTPPATGKRAEEMIGHARGMLVKAGFDVNESCGFHIHMDVSDVDNLPSNDQLNAVKRLWLTYMAFEDVLLSFLPPSRRSNIRYCAALRSEYHFDEIAKAKNMDALEQLWYRITNKQEINRAKNEHSHKSRYRGINLHPLFSGRHLEIRYHSGTLNMTKILEWANLHLSLTDWAMGSSFTSWDTYKNWINSIDLADKTSQLFSLAQLGEASCGYFLARQELWRDKAKPKQNDHFKSGMKVLEEEKEN